MHRLLAVCTLLTLAFATPAGAQQAGSRPESLAQLDADAAQAQQQVIAIINQPITHLHRTDEAAVYPQGWFHPGAIKPDFNTVDVRDTQQLIYSKFEYVTSDLNPDEMFIGGELEFNAMTKYFYTDRSLPKARLTGDQMVEVNRLYRIIGRDEAARAAHWRMTLLLAGAAVTVLLGALVLIRRYL